MNISQQKVSQYILSLYLEKSEKSSTHIEWRDVHRKDGTIFKQRKHVKISTPVKHFDEIKERKKLISSNGYQLQDVENFVKDIIDENFINKIRGQIEPNKHILLALPSNTGRNIIPNVMVDYLSEKLGLDIIDHESILHGKIYESKKLLGIDKLLKKTEYLFNNLDTKGKEVIIVDDLFTTGLGIKNMKETLEENGHSVSDINITLGQTGGSTITDKSLDTIYNKIVEYLPNISPDIIRRNTEKLRGTSSTIAKQIILYKMGCKRLLLHLHFVNLNKYIGLSK